jgi:hypothetical protein
LMTCNLNSLECLVRVMLFSLLGTLSSILFFTLIVQVHLGAK